MVRNINVGLFLLWVSLIWLYTFIGNFSNYFLIMFIKLFFFKRYIVNCELKVVCIHLSLISVRNTIFSWTFYPITHPQYTTNGIFYNLLHIQKKQTSWNENVISGIFLNLDYVINTFGHLKMLYIYNNVFENKLFFMQKLIIFSRIKDLQLKNTLWRVQNLENETTNRTN